MNINNFENHINKTIVDRGYDYYNAGNIIETYIQEENEYVFQVQGSEGYEVIVKIDENGEILYSTCDCPYDMGPICKHEVAAYFELFKMLNTGHNNNKSTKEIPKQPAIQEVLNHLSKEELIRIIVDITYKDSVLKNNIIFRYSQGDDTQELEKCKKLIDSIVRKHTGRGGFITYRETSGFISEMDDVLDKVRDNPNPLLALDIAFLVLEEAIEAFQYADDSNGEIGSLVTETIELMGEIASDSADSDSHLREKVFNKLLDQSDSKVFDGWEEYQIDLLSICAEFADIAALRNKLRMKIERLIERNSTNEYKKYSNEHMLQLLFEMIEEYGNEEEVEQFIQDHLTFTSFRDRLINKYMKEKNYEKVLELALSGEKQDKKSAGLVSKWKKIRYTAYKKLLLKEEQAKLAKELLIGGDFEYYRDLKQLVTEEKAAFYNRLKQELKENKNWHGRSMYLKLIVEENDLDEIMEFVRENPRNIENYAEVLIHHFKDEVLHLYKKYIISAASSSSNRKDYQAVCRILKRYKKIAGNKKQEEMIHELSALYHKRPAFLDELSKIK